MNERYRIRNMRMKAQIRTEAFHSGQRAAQNSGVSRTEALEDTEDKNADMGEAPYHISC